MVITNRVQAVELSDKIEFTPGKVSIGTMLWAAAAFPSVIGGPGSDFI